MKREAIIIRSSEDGKRNIAVDLTNYKRLIRFLLQDERHKSKFIDLCNIILGGLKNPNLYDKENINRRCKNVTAMKFFKGQENARIYCQEIKQENKRFIVVASELLEKRKQRKTNRGKLT